MRLSHTKYPRPLRYFSNNRPNAQGWAVTQPDILGFPVSYNPDDHCFYLHDATEDGRHGGDVLARLDSNKNKAWANLIERARSIRAKKNM